MKLVQYFLIIVVLLTQLTTNYYFKNYNFWALEVQLIDGYNPIFQDVSRQTVVIYMSYTYLYVQRAFNNDTCQLDPCHAYPKINDVTKIRHFQQ